MKTIDITVQELGDEPRLDKIIPLHVKDLSRAAARRLIEGGSVYLNQKRCKMNSKGVARGDKIRIHISEKKEEEKVFELTQNHILFEDQDLIVVNKPPFLPTHETIDNSRHHLALAIQTFLAAREKKKPTQIYLGIHHRLDRDTSGVILFSKRKEANPALAQAFQNREVEKTYLAICQGAPQRDEFTIKSFIGPSPRNKRFYASVERGGKYAETLVRFHSEQNRQGKKISLMEARPKTGRTHQIRVHLSENRLPILGDAAYGVSFPGVQRVLLHAWKLEILGKTFTAPIPDDFRNLDFASPEA